MLIIIALLIAAAIFLGGLFALKFKDKSHLIVGFSAGTVVGVAFFDLLPEAIEIGSAQNIDYIATIVAVGFVIYLLVDRFFHTHSHGDIGGECHVHEHKNEDSNRGVVRASSISIHSLLDGVGIGLAFQVSNTLGIVVTLAVLAHGFSDGINTVSSIIKDGGSKNKAFRWLIADSVAPAVGILSTLFFSVTDKALAIVLALFTGFFIYLGASDLVPESYHSHPTKWTTILTLAGMGLIYIVIKIAHSAH